MLLPLLSPCHTSHLSCRCLAHIINIATQALIAAYSSTPHLTINTSLNNLDATFATFANVAKCNGIGIICLIAVKARLSPRRGAMLRDLHTAKEIRVALNLILNMRVRWSSTLAMLEQAYALREFINHFIFKMSSKESNAKKRRKLEDLQMTLEEWKRVANIIHILKVCCCTSIMLLSPHS